jgi:MFS family permease
MQGLGSIIFGYDLGVIAGILPAPDFIVCLLSSRKGVVLFTKFSPARHGFTIPQSKSPRVNHQYFRYVICLLSVNTINLFCSSWMVCLRKNSFLSLHLLKSSSFFGMIPVAYLADLFGRRKTIQCGAAIYMCVLRSPEPLRLILKHHTTSLGGALQTGAKNMDMMLAGRFFAGFGVG